MNYAWLKPPARAPTITSFTAAASPIVATISTTLDWVVTGAVSLSIDQGVGDVTGQTQVAITPLATTTYTLTATGKGGKTSTAQVTVTVRHLLDEDANTIAHVWFNGTDLVDTKGIAWTKNGAPTQVAASGLVPAGATGWTAAINYATSVVNDAFDLNTLAISIVYAPNGEAGTFTPFLIDYNNSPATGWRVRHNTGVPSFAWAPNGAAIGTASEVAGPNVFHCGRDATAQKIYAKLNLGTFLNAAATTDGPATDRAAIIGGGGTTSVIIYEILIRNVAPSDALGTADATAAKARAGITAW